MRDAAVRVRSATCGDEAFVLGLAARFAPARPAWRSYAEVVSGTQRELRSALRAASASAAVLIADSAAERLGFVYIVTHDDFFTGEPHGHVSELATVSDAGGVGSLLLAAAENWSRERGFRYVSLNVTERNERAQVFYERRAYTPEYRHLVKLLAPAPAPNVAPHEPLEDSGRR